MILANRFFILILVFCVPPVFSADYTDVLSDKTEAQRHLRDYEAWLIDQEGHFKKLLSNSSKDSAVRQKVESAQTSGEVDSVYNLVTNGCKKDISQIDRGLNVNNYPSSKGGLEFDRIFNQIMGWAEARKSSWTESEKTRFKTEIFMPLHQSRSNLQNHLEPRERKLRQDFQRFKDSPPFICDGTLFKKFVENKKDRLSESKIWADAGFDKHKGIGQIWGEDSYTVYISKRDDYLYIQSRKEAYKQCKTRHRYNPSTGEITLSGKVFNHKNELLSSVQRELVKKQFWRDNHPTLICK